MFLSQNSLALSICQEMESNEGFTSFSPVASGVYWGNKEGVFRKISKDNFESLALRSQRIIS